MQNMEKNVKQKINDQKAARFFDDLMTYFQKNKRDLPWRKTTDPYEIMVSEIMLQQTQVNRVIPKYQAFLRQFPDVEVLAAATLAEVLGLWSGLGYNRRAKFLHQAAQKVTTDFEAIMPETATDLVSLPGIGKNTAGAILAYAYDRPVVYVETNIRTVLLRHYFADQTDISDKDLEGILRELITQVESAREFYWAMMDYGTFLKTTDNNIARSKHYVKQSKFTGSKRQIRGQIIKILVDSPQSFEALQKSIDDQRFPAVLEELIGEQLILQKSNRYSLG